jgi:hypothetical protein
MPAMIHRRIAALVAICSVAFASLWPLVSLAAPRDPHVPVFICTHADGVQQPGTPADGAGDFHCPLCVASGEAVVPLLLAMHAAPQLHAIAITEARREPPGRLFSARPPPSRAPPALS